MKRNILFISHSPNLAGAEMCLLNLIKRLDKNFYSGLVLVPDEGPFSSLVKSYGWEVEVFPIIWWVSMSQRKKCHFRQIFMRMSERVSKIVDLIKRHEIGLVYTNTITCLDGAISARLANIPHIWHIHELPSLQNYFKFYCPMWMVRKIVYSLSKKIIVPSRIVKKDILYKDDGKIEIIPNGVDPQAFANIDTRKFKAEIALKKGTRVVCMLGAIYENKKPYNFIEAARIVSEKIDDVIFMLVGSSERHYMQTITNKINELGLEKKLLLLGFRSDVSEILNSIDMLVSASSLESFSLVLLEAMASAKPVIATRSGGPEDIVDHDVTGFLVNHDNPLEMANAMFTLLEDKTRAIEMGLNGRKKVYEFFTIDKYFESVQRIIDNSF